MKLLDSLDWRAVRDQYDVRESVSKRLRELLRRRLVDQFAELSLGISQVDGNYSAAEHSLGNKVLARNTNAASSVVFLARQLASLTSARSVPDLIRDANIDYLKIGVGSEISCMVNPTVCWVANTRTIWTHLLVKHGDDVRKADEELKLYREADASSEMAYEMWAAIHAELGVALTKDRGDGHYCFETRPSFCRRDQIPVGGRHCFKFVRQVSRLKAGPTYP